MMYALNGIVVNEFLGHKFNTPFGNSTLGRIIVTSRGLFAEAYWYWIAFGALIGFMLIFNLCYTLSLKFLDPYGKTQANATKHEARDAIPVELSSMTTNDGNQNKKRGMVLPFEPHCITFDNIKYSVNMPQLFLMKRGGEEIYVGPVGRQSCELIKYFEDIEGVSKIKDGYNPATWMLEVSTSSQELSLGVDFTEIYKNSELYTRNKALIAGLSEPRPGSNDLHFPTQFSQSFFTQCRACLWKQRCSYWRNQPYTAVRFAFTTVIALMFGSMFWDLGSKRKTIQDLSNAMGSLYTSVLFLGIQYASTVQPVVDIERTVFYRERAAGMYSALPYAFAQFGDFDDVLTIGETVKDYLLQYYGFKHDFIGVVAGVHVGLVVVFAVIFAYCIKSFNFQKR
ncbi:hypothetical protein L1887_03768 [Cichorium endivia]|nr:hypothetical protein L1887_03768 [Cichorium endivia]